MAIDSGVVEPLFTNLSVSFDTVTVDLERPRTFVAFITITWDDPVNNYDRDNAIAADILTVDGNFTAVRAAGGDHFGPLGPPGSPNPTNVFQGAVVAYGQVIEFWLRRFGPDIQVGAEAVVIF
jgi:hypothetical protein